MACQSLSLSGYSWQRYRLLTAGQWKEHRDPAVHLQCFTLATNRRLWCEIWSAAIPCDARLSGEADPVAKKIIKQNNKLKRPEKNMRNSAMYSTQCICVNVQWDIKYYTRKFKKVERNGQKNQNHQNVSRSSAQRRRHLAEAQTKSTSDVLNVWQLCLLCFTLLQAVLL